MTRLAALALVALLSACGDPSTPGGEASDDFEDRDPLPSCGSVDVDQGDDWRAADPEAWDCFDEALRSGGEAELALTYPTVEGDPIGLWYRVSGGRLEIYEDSTRDAFGSGEWAHQECAAPERLPRNVHTLGC